MQHSSWAFICKPHSAIKSPHDFLDRTLLISKTNHSPEHLAVLHYESLPVKRTTIVPSSSSMFTHGEYDIFFGDILKELYHLDSKNTEHVIISPRTYGVDFYGDTIFTSENELKKNRADVVSFREASIKGWKYAFDHPHEISHTDDTISPKTGDESILLVDDEISFLRITGRILGGLGYKVTTIKESPAALAVFNDNPFTYDLVITDQTMPDMTGIELIEEIHAIRPGIPVIICTGNIHLLDEDQIKNLNIQDILVKPVTKKDLGLLIRRVLGQSLPQS